MGQLLSSGGEESRMLAALIVRGAKGDTPVAGRKGEQISSSLEKWVRARESRRMEEKVMRFRGFVMTGVLGAVAAMVSSMGPLVSGLSFAGGPAPASPTLLKECAASMAALSSAMLGLYISGWRGIMNAALSLAVFALVSTSVAPLASVPLQGLGAIK
jgi:hypothetical protein